MENRTKSIAITQKLARVLGNGYRIEYDVCESGLTYCYYNDKLYKRVPNSEFESGNINVANYRAPQTMSALYR